MRSTAVAAALLCAVSSCTPKSAATAYPDAEPATGSSPPEPADSAEQVEVPAAPPVAAEGQAILDKINDAYKDETDAGAWSNRFEKEGREVHDRKAEVIAELGIQAGDSVADVGAGTGLYTMPFADAVGQDGRVYAVDIQPYFLDHIRQRATKAGHQHIETIQATAESAQLPSAALDLVFMCDAYHHVEQPQAYLRSLKAALKPDGRLVIIDYRRGKEGTWRHGHIRATPETFRAEIEAAGFELDREVTLLKENFFFVFRPA